MIDSNKLKKSILPGTSRSMFEWILFTNYHHNGKRREKETIEKFRGTELGKCLDFDILDDLKTPEEKPEEDFTILIPANLTTKRHVHFHLSQEQAGELFGILEQHKEEHPKLHELVYLYMTRDLFLRIQEIKE